MSAPSSPERIEAVAKALRAANPFAGVTDDEWAWMVQANGFAAVAVAALDAYDREHPTPEVERLGAMVEWLCEVIVDAREACQRAERIEPKGSAEWVESGIAMRTTALREVRAILDRERTAHPSALDRVTAERDEAARIARGGA